MLVRYLVNAWLRQAAQEKLQEAVSEFAREALPIAGQETNEPDEQDATEPQAYDAAIIFAVSVESGGLVDRLEELTRRRFKYRTEYHGLFQGRRVVVVDAGIGLEAARRATERTITRYRPNWVISAGFASALQPGIRRGHLVMVDTVIGRNNDAYHVGLKLDPQTAAISRGLHVGRLLSVEHPVRSADKKRTLAEQHAALAYDTETAGVAEACHRMKTRFLAVRVISEAVDDVVPPEIETLVNQSNTAARLGAAAGAIFRRPSSVKEMWRLKEESINSSDRLAKFLQGVLEQLH